MKLQKQQQHSFFTFNQNTMSKKIKQGWESGKSVVCSADTSEKIPAAAEGSAPAANDTAAKEDPKRTIVTTSLTAVKDPAAADSLQTGETWPGYDLQNPSPISEETAKQLIDFAAAEEETE